MSCALLCRKPTPSTIGKLAYLIVCAWMFLAAGASGETLAVGRRPPETSPEYEVQRALGRVTYALRSGDAIEVTEVLSMLRQPGAAPVTQDQALAFCEVFHAPPRSPLVYFANPLIVIQGTLATVTCLAHWQLMSADGSVVRLKESERFVFESVGDRFVLKQARSTPLVIAHRGDRVAYARSLVEVDQAIASGSK